MSKIRKRYRVRSYRFIGVSDPYKSENEAEEERMDLSYTNPENHFEVEAIIEPVKDLPKYDLKKIGVINPFQELMSAHIRRISEEENAEIIRQMCEFKSFKEFIKDNYYIVYNLRNDNKIKVRERVFPKSMLDSQGFKEESEWVGTHEEPPYPKPPVEQPYKIGQDFEGVAKEIQKNRRELGICPVCGCPDYVAHYLKEMGLTDDLWKVFRKCKNCGVIRSD